MVQENHPLPTLPDGFVYRLFDVGGVYRIVIHNKNARADSNESVRVFLFCYVIFSF